MTISNFKSLVAAYMNRSTASLTSVNSQDILLQAMNDARRAAQRDHAFEMLATEDAYLATSSSGANWQTAAKTTPAGATAILMRRVDEVWNYTTASAVATYYPRTTRIPYNQKGVFRRVLPTVDNTTITNPQQYTVQDRWAYSTGANLYLTNAGSSTIVKLIGIKWLDDLTGAEDPDIFLTYFTDWFKYATIAALNIYLKDSERFPIDVTILNAMWASVKTLDGEVANQGDMASLS